VSDADAGDDDVIDEAFAWLGENVVAYTDIAGEIRDEAAGVRMRIEEMSVDTPVELDVRVDADGHVSLGCAPPLYPVETTFAPVLHRLRFTARATLR
jgi:hypothetical protein